MKQKVITILMMVATFFLAFFTCLMAWETRGLKMVDIGPNISISDVALELIDTNGTPLEEVSWRNGKLIGLAGGVEINLGNAFVKVKFSNTGKNSGYVELLKFGDISLDYYSGEHQLVPAQGDTGWIHIRDIKKDLDLREGYQVIDIQYILKAYDSKSLKEERKESIRCVFQEFYEATSYFCKPVNLLEIGKNNAMFQNLITNIKLNPGFFIVLLAFFFAFFTFRFSIKTARQSLLAIIQEELDLIERWFRGSYDKNSNDKGWYNPLFTVIGLKRSFGIQGFFSNIYTSLLSKKLLVCLTALNQGLGRFNQNIDRYSNFLTSQKLTIEAYNAVKKDIEDKNISQRDIYNKIQNSKQYGLPYTIEVAYFLEFIYELNKAIHVDGIGSANYYNEQNFEKKLPEPHQSYILAKEALGEERKKRYFSLKHGWLYIDIIILLISISLCYLVLF